MSDKTELKKVMPLNDYVAVLQEIDVPDGIEMDPKALQEISNEGIVVGLGPNAISHFSIDGESSLNIGDRVIFHNKRYLALHPASGGYEGRTVLMIRAMDFVAHIGRTDKYEIV